MGRKAIQQLSQVDEATTRVVDYGFFAIIAFPLLQLMKFLFLFLKITVWPSLF